MSEENEKVEIIDTFENGVLVKRTINGKKVSVPSLGMKELQTMNLSQAQKQYAFMTEEERKHFIQSIKKIK